MAFNNKMGASIQMLGNVWIRTGVTGDQTQLTTGASQVQHCTLDGAASQPLPPAAESAGLSFTFFVTGATLTVTGDGGAALSEAVLTTQTASFASDGVSWFLMSRHANV
jgi:hypothetical protein